MRLFCFKKEKKIDMNLPKNKKKNNLKKLMFRFHSREGSTDVKHQRPSTAQDDRRRHSRF